MVGGYLLDVARSEARRRSRRVVESPLPEADVSPAVGPGWPTRSWPISTPSRSPGPRPAADEQRTAIVLIDLAGLTTAEVADQLRCPRNTVLSRVHRGRRRLATLLSREDVGSCTMTTASSSPSSTAAARRGGAGLDEHLLDCEACSQAARRTRLGRLALERPGSAPAGLTDRVAASVALAGKSPVAGVGGTGRGHRRWRLRDTGEPERPHRSKRLVAGRPRPR